MKYGNNYHSVYKINYHIVFCVKYCRKVITKFINAYKSASSRLIKKEFPIIKSKLWKKYFWSRSFLVLSVGGASIEVIKKYIQGQGEDEDS